MRVEWNGVEWTMTTADGFSVHPTATGQYPPKTGWLSGLVLEYDSNWIDDDGVLLSRDYENLMTSVNLDNKELIKRIEMSGGGCGIKETIEYNQSMVETNSWYKKALKYIGEDCPVPHIEPLLDVDGDFMYDSNGELIFVQPE